MEAVLRDEHGRGREDCPGVAGAWKLNNQREIEDEVWRKNEPRNHLRFMLFCSFCKLIS